MIVARRPARAVLRMTPRRQVRPAPNAHGITKKRLSSSSSPTPQRRGTAIGLRRGAIVDVRFILIVAL